MKKLSMALILTCMGLMSLRAATVSVLVVEAGLPPGAKSSISASIWESGLMDAFFDAGHIVFNAPVMHIKEISGSLPPDVMRDFNEARLGGADFFVLVLLNYSGNNQEKLPEYPNEVLLKVFQVSTGSLLYETSITGWTKKTADEEFLIAKQNAGKLIPRLLVKG